MLLVPHHGPLQTVPAQEGVCLAQEFLVFLPALGQVAGEYTEETTHEYSHAIDGMKYAYSDIYTSTKLKTLNKAVFSI